METKSLNKISIIVVILLIIVGWFFVFSNNHQNEERYDGEILEAQLSEDTCLKYPDSPVCINEEGDMEKDSKSLIEDTCLKYPDSPICQ
jgi:hypothetical protein